MQNKGVFCVISLSVIFFIGFVNSVPTFTGYADQDFASLSTRDAASYYKFNNTPRVTLGKWTKDHGRNSGIDMDAVHALYDDQGDTLYIGIQCAGICGDTDGDGNPSGVDPIAPEGSLGEDSPNLCYTEQFSLMFWLNLPEEFSFEGKPPGYFFPTMVVGVDYPLCLWDEDADETNWFAYEWQDYKDCLWPTPENDPTNPCVTSNINRVLSPGQNVYSTNRLNEMNGFDPINYPNPLPSPSLFTYFPNVTHPHIEFTLGEFSKYPQQTFTPGAFQSQMRVGFAGSSGSSADANGEDAIYSTIWALTWDCEGFPNGQKTLDDCGVCGGDNSSCADCFGVPNGPDRNDACNVCGGDNSTCWDCQHVPNGPSRYDACGVCDGDNQTCWDCQHVPNGPSRYDACGVCDGNNQTCWDCQHVPNGPKRYDACGVCDGNNQTCWDCHHVPNGAGRYDACGVCDGNNQTCWDCQHVPNGPKRYDACGVCGGDDSTCKDCAGTVNGTLVIDACNVCGGDDSSCWDCQHVPNGPSTYDACGVCDGDDSSCWDCEHVPNGLSRYDECGVCGGDDTTCQDCAFVPNGPSTYDDCGVCGGDNSTCWDCKHIPKGPNRYDTCGVCDGDNSTCHCYKYLGYDDELCFALLRWSIAASRTKITDTLDILYTIKNELPYYDYTTEAMELRGQSLVGFIDTLHNFCDDCLDSFDYAQVWFAERLAGNCADCDRLEESDFTWQL